MDTSAFFCFLNVSKNSFKLSLFTISSCSALTISVLIGQGDKKLKSYKFTGGAIKINQSTSGLLIRV